jgi:hypothetical protein
MRTQASFHRRGNAQGLMDARKVVPHVEQRDLMNVIVNLFGESISQASEAAHLHPHGEVLTLHKAGRNVARVRIADNFDALGAKTLRRAVAFLSFGITDGMNINLVAVRGQLDSIRNTLRNVPKEVRRKPGFSPPNKPANHQLGIRINRRECPYVSADALLGHLQRDVLLLGVAKTPDFIDLHALRFDVPQSGILVLSAGRPDFAQQLQDGLLAHASHAASGTDGATFDQGRNHCRFLRDAEYVCHEPIIRQRFRIRKWKVQPERFLRRFLSFCPTRFSGFSSAPASLFVGHSLKATFSPYLAALRAHLPHDLLDYRKLLRFRGLDGFQNYAAGILDRIKFCISAFPLWHNHNLSVARMAGGVNL